MDFYDILNNVIVDTKGVAAGWTITPDSSLAAFLPELVLCVTVVLMLAVRLFRLGDVIDRTLSRFTGSGTAFLIALLGSLVALFAAAPWRHLGSGTAIPALDAASAIRMEIFTGLLVYDTFAVYVRSILLLFLALFVIFTRLSGLPARDDATDIYSLVLGATLGMCLMASANHLLMVFLAVEMASVPSYALAGMLKGRRESSEAALKYSVYGAGAAGVMLYGISLIAGVVNTVHLPSVAVELAKLDLPAMISSGQGTEQLMVLAVGGLMLAVGLAFKLSAVPFHFWCPDVFEGAAAEIGAFLSVSSKAAALALLVRLVVGLGTISPGTPPFDEPVRPGDRTAQQLAPAAERSALALFSVADEPHGPEAEAAHAAPPASGGTALGKASANARLAPVRDFTAKLVAFLAILTCTFGNLAAYGQTNIKRLLAYSTIAHAGYMMMAVAPLAVLATVDPAGAKAAVAGLAIYIFVYLFMNLGAFAVVAFVRNATRSEQIGDYGGLIRSAPVTAICMSIMLFSLIGLPPMAGFIGKFAIFASIADAYRTTGEGYLMLLLVVGGVNTFLSLFYYLRVVKSMTIDPEPDHRAPFRVPVLASAFLLVLTVPTMFLLFGWNGLWDAALVAAEYLLG